MYGLLWQDNIGWDTTFENLESRGAKKINKVVQMKFLAMHY